MHVKMNHFKYVNMCLICVLFVNFTCGKNDFLRSKPDGVQSCQLADPEFTKCSTNTVQQIFTKLAGGFAELYNLPSINPLRVDEIRLFQGSGPVSINAVLYNVSIKGFDKLKIIESQVNPKDFSWLTTLHIPKIRIDAQYDLKGKILIIPLVGHGTLWLEPADMSMVMRTKTRLYEKSGHTFYNVTSTKIEYNLTGLKLRLNNLFDGLRTLEESTNKFMNDNWRLASESLKPIIAKTIEDIMLELLQKIFHYLPADYIITDIPKPAQVYGESGN